LDNEAEYLMLLATATASTEIGRISYLHAGPILGDLLRWNKFNNVISDGQKPIDLLLPPRFLVGSHGLQTALLTKHRS